MIPDAVKKYVEAIVTKRISLVKSRMICADCGKFWECSPQGPCLFECPDCGGVPQCVAYGSNQLQERLSFDCRSAQPLTLCTHGCAIRFYDFTKNARNAQKLQ